MKRLPNAEVIHLTKKTAQPWGFDVVKNEVSDTKSKVSPQNALFSDKD